MRNGQQIGNTPLEDVEVGCPRGKATISEAEIPSVCC